MLRHDGEALPQVPMHLNGRNTGSNRVDGTPFPAWRATRSRCPGGPPGQRRKREDGASVQPTVSKVSSLDTKISLASFKITQKNITKDRPLIKSIPLS